MIATYVEDKLTPVPVDDMLRIVGDVLPAYIPGARDKVRALVLAKMALETARFVKVHRFNLGNQKCTPTMGGQFTCFTCDEIIQGKRIVFRPDTPHNPKDPLGLPDARFPPPTVPPGNPQSRFRAFANAYDGVYQYFDLLSNLKRYRASWIALASGDAAVFIGALASAGYFTADRNKYLKAVVSLQAEFERRIAGATPVQQLRDPELERLFERALAAQFSLDELLRETPPSDDPGGLVA